jgi:hypothetical protein
MLNRVVKQLCIEVLQSHLLGVPAVEPAAIGAKLVRAGAAPEDVQDIWSGVLASIGRHAMRHETPALEISDPLREFLAEYRKVMEERPCRARRRIARRSATRLESRPVI